MSIRRESDRRTRVWSYCVWGGVGLLFLVLETLGLLRRGPLKGVPFFTLSETDWALLRWCKWLRFPLAILFADLAIHLLFGTSLTPGV